MIRALSETLQAILDQPGLPNELAEAEIVFDRPVAQFNPQKTCINLFLYDIRENLELRSNESTIERQDGRTIIRRPAMRVACTYLITAWVVGGTEVALQEHRLLSQIFQALSRYDTIPNTFLQGDLRGQEPPMPMIVTSADGLKNPAEFWTSLGTPLRASLAVMVTISMQSPKTETVFLARSHGILLESNESFFPVKGQITNDRNEPVTDAKIFLDERNWSTKAKDRGIYEFSSVPEGTYTLRVQLPDRTTYRFSITVPVIANENYNLRLS